LGRQGGHEAGESDGPCLSAIGLPDRLDAVASGREVEASAEGDDARADRGLDLERLAGAVGQGRGAGAGPVGAPEGGAGQTARGGGEEQRAAHLGQGKGKGAAVPRAEVGHQLRAGGAAVADVELAAGALLDGTEEELPPGGEELLGVGAAIVRPRIGGEVLDPRGGLRAGGEGATGEEEAEQGKDEGGAGGRHRRLLQGSRDLTAR
jgi:hypothetical protein